MANIKRRTILSGAAAATVSAMVGGKVQAGLLGGSVPLVREDHRVVIIGSGFGGGVSALRLAEAGVDVTVLERGKWWPTGPNAETFPHPTTSPDQRALWYGSTPAAYNASMGALTGMAGLPSDTPPYAGLLEPIANPNLTVVVAAGVGGGSLVYQGMTLQPTEEVFAHIFPDSISYQKMDKVFYPRVAKMLQIETAPDELINTTNYRAPRAFAEKVVRAGYDVEKIPMPIDWSWALREVAGEMKPSYSNGDCALGVNNGGKHSVDVTYIAKAMKTGHVTVNALHNVQNVAKLPDGRWQVFVDHTDEEGNLLEQKILTTKALIMSAGSAGSTRLLQRAAYNGDIPALSGLGEGWGTNGDRILTWTTTEYEFGAEQGGPVIYGSKEWDDAATANTIIQASIPPLPADLHTTMMVGFGVSDTRAKWIYNPLTNDSHLLWPREGDWQLHQRILQRSWEIAGSGSSLGDSHAVAPMTWHPLGGACMGTVCDTSGRVYDQPGLYVLDGALIPGSCGACNPSMTIAAIAEMAIDDIIQNDIGSLI